MSSKYPLPTISTKTSCVDWFHSLSHCLGWNERKRKASSPVSHRKVQKYHHGISKASNRDGDHVTAGNVDQLLEWSKDYFLRRS
jgi:hypothetical protein